MARIRSVKPEFWDSPDTARASLRCRLFYIAMWNWADDWGIGDANAKRLMGFAFPNDDDISAADYPTLRDEVSDCYGVEFYTVDGRQYYCIPSWEDHQRTEKKARRANPGPDEADDPVNTRESERPRFCGGTSDAEQRIPARGNRGTGEEGTGEQGNGGRRKQDLAHLAASVPFDDFWDVYPKKNNRADAEKAWAKAVRVADPVQIIEAARVLAESPHRPAKQFIPYGATWLNRQQWNDPPPEPPEGERAKPTAAQRNLSTVEYFERQERNGLEIQA